MRLRILISTGLLALIATLLVSGHGFFWDTVQLGAMQGDWFFRHGWQGGLLPDRIDSGHIPFFGWYLALWWSILGQSLWVSHLAMAPWLWLLGYQLVRMASQVSERQVWWVVALLIADPVLLGQAVLISPDIILAGVFLLGVNAILREARAWLIIAIILLGLISLRGMLVGVILFLFDLSRQAGGLRRAPLATLGRQLLPYLPGGLLALAYLAYHYWAKGWIGVHEDSPWAGSFNSGSLAHNAAVLAWRWLDYGRIFLWLSVGGLTLMHWWPQRRFRLQLPPTKLRPWLVLTLLTGIFLGLPALFSGGLTQHRYFLPFFLSLSLLTAQLLSGIVQPRARTILWGLLILALLSGNRWIYPDRIAQGWDSTLAQLPYYAIRAEALDFLATEDIPLAEVGTAFPEVGPRHFRELNGQMEGMIERDLGRQTYVFYSNVMNDFTDEELATLQTWTPIFRRQRAGVIGVVYRRP
ncbi:MAG: hypothetical protein KDC54_09720 [Lewinella sp.]|nr:hypothetical protein [Lewinella sp.]